MNSNTQREPVELHSALDVVLELETVKHLEKDKKVKTLEAVAEHVSASKVVKTHYSVVYQKEASTILLVSNSQLLTSRI